MDLDFEKKAAPATVASVSGYDVLPTIQAPGLEELQGQAVALLQKFQALPLENTVTSANNALAAIKGATANLDKLAGPGGSLDKTLKNAEKLTAQMSADKDIGLILHNFRDTSAQLRTGQNLTEATDTVKRQPWRLIWPSAKKYDRTNQIEQPAASRPAQRHKSVIFESLTGTIIS
ncbi:MAG: hypothetical protein JOY96_11625 [Verrucomicrobia bacterium]|nr:hypothetical protein [Verrucomicrobiota bacterium]